MNDILIRLQNGESIDDIAAEFSKLLNEASAAYQAEVEAKKEAEKQKHKIAIMRQMYSCIAEYVTLYHPDLSFNGQTIQDIFGDIDDMSDEDLLEVSEAFDAFLELAAMPFFSYTPEKAHTVEKVPGGVKITGKAPLTETELDAIFNQFFNGIK